MRPYSFDAAQSQSQAEDSVYWEDNILEYVDDNDFWRWERDQEAATEVTIDKNGAFVGTFELEYSGSDISNVKLLDSGTAEWIRTDTAGTVTETSNPGAPCDPSQPDCGPEDPEFGSSSADCGNEYDAMQDAAWDADGASAMAAIAVKAGGPGNPLQIGLAINAGIKAGNAFGKLTTWVRCLIS